MRSTTLLTFLQIFCTFQLPLREQRRCLLHFPFFLYQIHLLLVNSIQPSPEYSFLEQTVRRHALDVRAWCVLSPESTRHFSSQDSFPLDDVLLCWLLWSWLDLPCFWSYYWIRKSRDSTYPCSSYLRFQSKHDPKCAKPRWVRWTILRYESTQSNASHSAFPLHHWH